MESLHLKHSGSSQRAPYLEFINTGTGDNAGAIFFKKDSSDPTANDKMGRIVLQCADSSGGDPEDFAEISFISSNVSSGSEASKMVFKTRTGGAATEEVLAVNSNTVDVSGDLNLEGRIKITSEQSDAPSLTTDGNGYIYSKTDGKLYWKSYGASEMDLTAAGVVSLSGSTDNTICTVTGASAIQGEANLTFDGTTLSNTGGKLNLESTSEGGTLLSMQQIDSSEDAPNFKVTKARTPSGTNTYAPLVDGDRIFSFNGKGAYNTSSTGIGAQFHFEVDGTPTGSATNIPTKILFNTATETDSPSKTRMKIDKNGHMSLVTDGVNLNFGVDSDVTLSHNADTGLSLNGDFTSNKVGVGTTSPGTLLQVEGTEPYITLKNTSSENIDGGDSGNSYTGCESRIIFEDHANNELARLQGNHDGTGDDTKGDLIFFTNNGTSITEGFRLNSSGNVGIGQTAPTHKLDVTGDVSITGDTTIGGFLKPRLDLIFGGYNFNGSNAGTVDKNDNFFKLIETSGIIDGSIMLPGAADSNSITYPINQPWGFSGKSYTASYTVGSTSTISDPGTTGTYFYHISGNNSGNNTTIILPVAVTNEIIVLVLDFQFSASSNNCHVTVYANGQADLDDNSIAITKPSAKVRAKDLASEYYYRITKAGADSSDREIAYVSGYVYCRPNSGGSYQIISMISTHRGGDHTTQEDTVSAYFGS